MNRLFLAIPVHLYDYPKIRHDFDPFLEGRWREEETLHITIAFLGKRFDAAEVIEKLDAFAWSFDPSPLRGWDYFTKSRVFVATTHNPSLQTLYDRLSPLLELESTLLKPHVTLMRVKGFKDSEAFFRRLKEPSLDALGYLKPQMILYRSILHPHGAEYQPLQEWHL